ncbi:hypothetical protein EYF80_052666 [Liparis tanakae]|uniref:Uncharacterized protein n=1 Tax=Liparis tanakae TaxID=230148 RepID=A0A4Z2F8G1_9TELE|nr:hypothetical protein EYF80_052666 [Liparis tanakae]
MLVLRAELHLLQPVGGAGGPHGPEHVAVVGQRVHPGDGHLPRRQQLPAVLLLLLQGATHTAASSTGGSARCGVTGPRRVDPTWPGECGHGPTAISKAISASISASSLASCNTSTGPLSSQAAVLHQNRHDHVDQHELGHEHEGDEVHRGDQRQLSPVDTLNRVRNAIPKLAKVAWRLRPSHGLWSVHSGNTGGQEVVR